MEMTNRSNFSPVSPYRKKRPAASKLIFIVCEGQATEHDYFSKVVSKVYDNIKTRIQVINIHEDILKKSKRFRTNDEERLFSSSKPYNLLDKMNEFKQENEVKYDFSKHDDEFWLVMDVDDHTEKEYIETFKNVLDESKKNGYGCAISNPFFEVWLLLHFDEINDEDRKYAVTESQEYTRTSHFRDRLRELNVSLYKQKYIRYIDDYTKDRIKSAIERAENLDIKKEIYPTDIGSTVYRLMKIIDGYDMENE